MLSTIGFPISPCLPTSGLIGISPRKFLLNSSAVLLTPPSPKIVYFFPPGVAHGYISKNNENHMIYGTSGYYNPKEEYKIKPSKIEINNYFK